LPNKTIVVWRSYNFEITELNYIKENTRKRGGGKYPCIIVESGREIGQNALALRPRLV
jgi:hypothetical protein